jgi:hypothetical protein
MMLAGHRCLAVVALLSVAAAQLTSAQCKTRIEARTASGAITPQPLSSGVAKLENGKKVLLKDIKETQTMKEMKSFRGGTDGFYRDTLAALRTTACVSEFSEGDVKHPRSFPCTQETFKSKPISWALPKTLRCIDTPVGHCEAAENCFWHAPVEGTMREAKITEESHAAAKQSVTDYGLGIGKLLVGPFFMAALVLVSCVIWTLCRCVCNKCCGGRKANRGGAGLDWRDKMPAIIVMLLSILAILICAGIGQSANDDISKGIDLTFSTADSCAGDMQSFMRATNQPLEKILGDVALAVADINENLSEDKTSFIGTGLDAMSAHLSDFGILYGAARHSWPAGCEAAPKGRLESEWSTQEGIAQATGSCIKCGPLCSRFGTLVGDAAAAFSENLGGVTSSLQDVISSMNVNLVAGQDELNTAIQAGVNMSKALADDELPAMRKQFKDQKKQSDELDTIRLGGMVGMFALMLVLSLLGLLGVFAGCTTCKYDDFMIYFLHITWMLGSVVAMLSFLLAGALLAVSVALGDSCNFMMLVSEDFTVDIPGSPGVILNSCFNDSSLVEAMNLTEKLDFAATLKQKFSGLNSMNIAGTYATAASGISNLSNQVETWQKSPGDLGWESVLAVQAGADATNVAAAGDFFTRMRLDIGTTKPLYAAEPSTFLSTFAPDTFNGGDISYEVAVDPADQFAYVDSVSQFSSTYESKLTNMQTQLMAVSDRTVGSVVENIADFKCQARCGWLVPCYKNLFDSFCQHWLRGAGKMAMALLCAGFFMIPIIFTANILAKRMTAKTREGSQGLAGYFARQEDGGDPTTSWRWMAPCNLKDYCRFGSKRSNQVEQAIFEDKTKDNLEQW